MERKWLEGGAASARSNILRHNNEFGEDFNDLDNEAYGASGRVEGNEGEYATSPIDVDVLAANTAKDVEARISSLPLVSEAFQAAVNQAMPAITERIKAVVKSYVIQGRFYGSGHNVRHYIAANVNDVVGLQLKL